MRFYLRIPGAPFFALLLLARPLDVGIVLKNAFGFGGVNCCLVLGRPPDDDASA